MGRFAYTVIATFRDDGVAEQWIRWLRDGHIAEVVAAGAIDARIVRLDGTEPTCEVRYCFASRAAFDAYERDHAPRLRAEGLKRFGPERGVAYRRTTGEVIE